LKILLVVAALFGLLSAPVSASALSTAEATTVVVRGDVYFDASDALQAFAGKDMSTVSRDMAFCSGVVMWSNGQDEDIVTARHCNMAKDLSEGPIMLGTVTPRALRVVFFDGDVGQVRSIYNSPNSDVAVIRVHSVRSHPFAFLSRRDLSIGQPLFVFGMPSGISWYKSPATAATGSRIANEFTDDESIYNGEIVFECQACEGGTSGAAVWNERGEVVGINVAGDGSGMQTMVAPAHILDVLTWAGK
jgi:S1-C subfamily serine protease